MTQMSLIDQKRQILDSQNPDRSTSESPFLQQVAAVTLQNAGPLTGEIELYKPFDK
jgi:hypothetical protein